MVAQPPLGPRPGPTCIMSTAPVGTRLHHVNAIAGYYLCDPSGIVNRPGEPSSMFDAIDLDTLAALCRPAFSGDAAGWGGLATLMGALALAGLAVLRVRGRGTCRPTSSSVRAIPRCGRTAGTMV